MVQFIDSCKTLNFIEQSSDEHMLMQDVSIKYSYFTLSELKKNYPIQYNVNFYKPQRFYFGNKLVYAEIK